MRNWYQALCEDFDIDLIELSKQQNIHITDKTLRKYRDKGSTPKKEPAINSIIELVSIKRASFTRAQLQEYFDDKHQKKPVDINRASCVSNIQKALEAAEQRAITFNALHDETEQIAEWLFDRVSQTDGLDDISLFLEDVRLQIKSQVQLDKVKELHDAIAPLFIINEGGIESALQQPLELKGVDSSSGPATAATAISRRNGHPQALKMELNDEDEYQFTTPENAVIESSFGIEEGDLKDRIAHRLSKKYNLIGPNKKYETDTINDKRYNELKMRGKIKLKSINAPFVYLANSSDYPQEQLKELANFPNVYCFANSATECIEIYGDETSYARLHDMYADLLNIDKGFEKVTELRALIATLPNINNAELSALIQAGEQMNSAEFIDNLDKYLSVFSNVSQGAASLPDAIEAGLSVFEKAELLFNMIIANVDKFQL